MRATRTSPGTPACPAAAARIVPAARGRRNHPDGRRPASPAISADAAFLRRRRSPLPRLRYLRRFDGLGTGTIAPALPCDQATHLKADQGAQRLRKGQAGGGVDLL